MGHMSPEMAQQSREVDAADLGRRIRAARLAAGLTQAELAAGEVSVAYISRIEDGQRRPEAGLLERMAQRAGTTLEHLVLGVSVDEQLELQVAVDHAELALAGGEPQRALSEAEAALEALEGKELAALRRQARHVRAFALEAVGDLQGAIEQLEEVTAQPQPDGAWLKALIGLSRCYREAGDLNRAINVGERAQQGVEDLGLQGLTEAIQLSLTVANAYLLRGDAAYALVLCRRAIADAEKHDSPVGKASAYWNASVLEARNGALESSLALARQALALFEAGEDARNLSRLRAQLANVQLALSPPDAEGALQTLDVAATEMAWSSASTVDVARQGLTRSRAHFLLGDHVRADQHLAEALAMMPPGAPVLSASALVLRGEIAAADGRIDEAREAYRSAVHQLTAAGADRDAAQLWFDLGALLAGVGDAAGALDAYQRAGASAGFRTPTPTVVPTRA
jgi:tetratricopeptide (TPR) repeat protein